MESKASGRARQRAVRSRLLGWSVGSAAGALIIALPDDDERVLSLSRTHGPAALDLLGIALLLLAWLPIAALLWSSRAKVRGKWAVAAAALGLPGLLVLGVSVAGDTGPEWVLGAALLVAAQLVALGAVWIHREQRRPPKS